MPANVAKTPECTFQIAPLSDLLDGLATLAGNSGHAVLVAPPGDGPDNPLQWAIQEVTQARNTLNQQDKARLCTNAVMNSRRALACLVEWYVDRDLGKYCKCPAATPKQQAAFLMRRGIIDELTARVLERAIEKRNIVEHQYTAPPLEVAEDVVELLRRTMMTMESGPSRGAFLFGTFLGGHGYGKNGRYAQFSGWCGAMAVVSRFPPRPWVGLVLPDDEVRALVRRAFVDTISAEELIQFHSLAEQKFGRPSSCVDHESALVLGRAIGVLDP